MVAIVTDSIFYTSLPQACMLPGILLHIMEKINVTLFPCQYQAALKEPIKFRLRKANK